MHMWKTLIDRLLFFKTDSNWYTVLYKAAFALFGSTDSFFDEFASVQLSAATAASVSRKANSAALEAVENLIFDKLCKQQRSKLNSRQLHALAELKSSSIVQSLYSVPCLQREQSQAAIQYSIDSSFIFLASRDGSNAEGSVDPDALVLEAAWWWCGVCTGDEDAFESIIGPRASIGKAASSTSFLLLLACVLFSFISSLTHHYRTRRGPSRLHSRVQLELLMEDIRPARCRVPQWRWPAHQCCHVTAYSQGANRMLRHRHLKVYEERFYRMNAF
jgi:hypothetical protein